MTNANDKQVAGNHYKGGKFQHWDWWIANCGVSGLAYAATKYVCRWRQKGGVKDLEKALHYVEKMIEAHTKEDGIATPVPLPRRRLALFMEQLQHNYQLKTVERFICDVLVSYNNVEELRDAEEDLQDLICKEKASGAPLAQPVQPSDQK